MAERPMKPQTLSEARYYCPMCASENLRWPDDVESRSNKTWNENDSAVEAESDLVCKMCGGSVFLDKQEGLAYLFGSPSFHAVDSEMSEPSLPVGGMTIRCGDNLLLNMGRYIAVTHTFETVNIYTDYMSVTIRCKGPKDAKIVFEMFNSMLKQPCIHYRVNLPEGTSVEWQITGK